MALSIKELPSSIELVTEKEHNVSRINSIKEKYKSLRQKSKGPTFALT